MENLKVFLKPGWVFTILLVVAFSYLAFTVLSPWQLGKDRQIVERNDHVERAFEVDPAPFAEIFSTTGAIQGDNEWMRVQITGRYLSDQETLLRLRPVESTPAYQSLVPFELNSGEIMLVNRGFEPDEAGSAPQIAPAPGGEVSIVAHARKNEVLPQTPPMEADGYTQVYGINTEQIAQLTGSELGQDYLLLAEGQPGALNPIPIPKLDRGNHLSYGFQWIAFGIMAPLGMGYFIYAELRERRRVREEQEELSLSDAASAPAPTQAGVQRVTQQATRSRYGKSRSDKLRNREIRRDNF